MDKLGKTININLIQHLELQMAAHQVTAVQNFINTLDPRQVPNEFKVRIAGIARRADLPLFSLKVLWIEIFERNNNSPDILFEYVACLRRLGLLNQAERWLAKLSERSLRFYKEKIFISMQQWDAKSAFESFRQLFSIHSLNLDQLEPVLKINYVSVLIDLGQFCEAIAIADDTLAQLQTSQNHLRLNLYELKGQAYYFLNELAEAEHSLALAKSLEGSQTNSASLFIRKWQYLVNLKKKPTQALETERTEIRKAAIQVGSWDTLRDLDFQVSVITENRTLYEATYFGTPYAGFRELMLRSSHLSPQSSGFVLKDSRLPAAPTVIDPLRDLGNLFGFGKAEHRLLCLLLSDTYKPFNVLRIFDNLFPDEIYNPFSSEKRVHNMVSKMRETLAKHNYKIELQTTNNGYRLRPNSDFSYFISPYMVFSDAGDMMLKVLRQKFQGQEFSNALAQEALGLTKFQYLRWIKPHLETRSILSFGQGKSTKYRIPAA